MHRLLPLVVAAVSLAVPAAASAAEFTVKPLLFDVVVGPNDDTPCTVNADLYTPNGTTKTSPAAAIMATNGFGGSKGDFQNLGSSFAKRGYVFLAYSGLGFGGSGCKITLDDPDWDGKAGSQLLSFLGGSKAAQDGTKIDYVLKDGTDDPRVGMIGGSYGGQIQFAVAGVDRRLDTIVPQITWNDLSYSLTPNNTDFERGVTYATPGVAKLDWPTLFFTVGVAGGIQAAFDDPSHIGACPNFADQACTSLVSSAATGYPSAETLAFLRHASVTSYMSRIRIPTFLSQGQSDNLFDLQEAIATYRALRAQDVPVKMLWRSSGHSGGGIEGEFNSTNLEAGYESRMALEWFDHYLRGIGDPPALNVSFLRDWASYTGDAAPAVGSSQSYPVGDDAPLFLSGTNSIVSKVSDIQAGTAPMIALPGVPGSQGGGFLDTGASDLAGTSVTFDTQPLAEDFDVAGVPVLEVKLDAPSFGASQSADPATKLVLFAKLYDADAAGDGALLPRNLISPVRIGDVTKPVRIELPGIVHRFPKGHRLRLVLATSTLSSRGNNVGGPISVIVDPASPATLTLPRLGQPGATGSGPSGTTPYGPVAAAPPGQTPGAGGPKKVKPAASLPSARALRSCASRRKFRIRLRKIARPDKLKSAVVQVNGKRIKVRRRSGRAGATIDLRGLPRGAFRIQITVRTARGKTLRSARSYRTCVGKKR